MRKKIWKIFKYTCIKTPAAAFLILTGLIAGMLVLMNSIEIRQYERIQGERGAGVNISRITVQGHFELSGLQEKDKITWYSGDSDVRLEGTIMELTEISAGLGRLVIHAEAAESVHTKNGGTAASPETTEQAVYAELPVGSQTVFAKLFRKEAGE